MEKPVPKRDQMEESDASENNGVTQRVEKSLDPSICLSYDIMRHIFQYLRGMDQVNAALVCKLWLANYFKWLRRPLCSYVSYSGLGDIVNYLNDVKVIKPSIGFYFINCLPHKYQDCSLQCNFLDDCIGVFLPAHCETMKLFSPFMFVDMSIRVKQPDKCHLSCAFLPQIPKVEIKSFKLEVEKDCIIQKTDEFREIICAINNYKTSILNRETSTCFMLFSNYPGQMRAERWASIIQDSIGNEIASVWGGVFEDVYSRKLLLFKKKDQKDEKIKEEYILKGIPYCVAILIIGSMQTWSVILEEKCNTKEQIEARLKLFKNKVKLNTHSIGFMFVADFDRNELYKKSNVESTAFKKLFPKVPLVPCFNYGAFGKNTIVETNDEKTSKMEERKPELWYNEKGTVFLILTYG